ncbi:cytochrome c oxidase assembly protein subunit 15 [Rhodoligotrophos appendicifer]|uniref:COX15/CtaA family protein n=1 Tax=Rhodoligotrophos appendicifer TaxID=987056 RepID=UPI001186A3B5|nr:COX15/CtaA family protein [Rhodoligotrophos appendicifer]
MSETVLSASSPEIAAASEKQRRARPAIRAWLVVVALLIIAMVTVGGATRLTESGLSITEWKPLLGAIPPLTHGDWTAAFDKYRQIPQYQILNKGMSLEEFQFIYWWEWAHRFLGRFIGIVFLVPFLFFWATGRLERTLVPKLALMFLLGGLQGALGWYMVASGLSERTSVSQYRLAAHLGLAVLIFGVIWWTVLQLGRVKLRPRMPSTGSLGAGLVAGLIFLQVLLGGLVAGLDAGMGYNTWPLMDGALIPVGLWHLSPWWLNMFENAMTVQFDHRILAYVITLAALAQAWRLRASGSGVANAAIAVVVLVLLQATGGILTLVHQVPLWLGLIHQAGAVILFAASLWMLHRTLYEADAPQAVRA